MPSNVLQDLLGEAEQVHTLQHLTSLLCHAAILVTFANSSLVQLLEVTGTYATIRSWHARKRLFEPCLTPHWDVENKVVIGERQICGLSAHHCAGGLFRARTFFALS